MASGATELAPMSTTTDPSVAISYAISEESLIFFNLKVDNVVQYGADVQWLSALFPGDAEVLYLPSAHLPPADRPRGRADGPERGEVHKVRTRWSRKAKRNCAESISQELDYSTP